MYIIILSGPPGSGKSTQANMLVRHIGFVHVSTGNILRSEIKEGTELGKLAQETIGGGNFMSDEIACQMISKVLKTESNAPGFIFDGFPRTFSQCFSLHELLKPFDAKVDIFIDLQVAEQELLTRLLFRNQNGSRADDSDVSIISHRFKLYDELTLPINDWYKSEKTYHTINGEGSILEVFNEIMNVLPEKLKK